MRLILSLEIFRMAVFVNLLFSSREMAEHFYSYFKDDLKKT